MSYVILGLFAAVVLAGLVYLILTRFDTPDRQDVVVTRPLSVGYFKVWTDLTPNEIEEIPGVVHAAADDTDRTGAIRVDLDRRYTGQYLRRELLRLTKANDVSDVWSDAVDDVLGKDK